MKSKLSKTLKALRAQRESIYGRRFANQRTPLDWMRLAKETLPNATRLKPESGFLSMNFLVPLQMNAFDVREKRDTLIF